MTMFRLKQSKKWCKTEVLTDDRVTLVQAVKTSNLTSVNYRIIPAVGGEGKLICSAGSQQKGCPKNWFMASWTLRLSPDAVS